MVIFPREQRLATAINSGDVLRDGAARVKLIVPDLVSLITDLGLLEVDSKFEHVPLWITGCSLVHM